MNIHENKGNSNRSKATCGYCRESGHNQYQCPHVKGDWENFLSRLEIPKDEDGNPIRRGYNYATYFHASGFDPLIHDIANNALASWFRNCKKAYVVQKERGFNLNQKRKGSTANRTCGFCGGKDHTRPIGVILSEASLVQRTCTWTKTKMATLSKGFLMQT